MAHFPDVLVKQLAQDARDGRSHAVARMLGELKPQTADDYAALFEAVSKAAYDAGYRAARYPER